MPQVHFKSTMHIQKDSVYLQNSNRS